MHYVLIGIGGSAGAALRYIVSIIFHEHQTIIFPFATLTVNLLGCFILGLLSSGLEQKIKMKQEYLSAIKTGVIGSFTTFSSFSVETVQLLQHDYYFRAFVYFIISGFFGLALAALGMIIGKYLWRGRN